MICWTSHTNDCFIELTNIVTAIVHIIGQERYRAITTAYYRGALGAMLVYDSTREATLDSIPRWLSELREQYVTPCILLCIWLSCVLTCTNFICACFSAHKEISLLMVGNKCDVDDDPNKQVSTESAESMADELHIKCLETSAKTGMNVEKAFITIVESIYANNNALASTVHTNKTSTPQNQTFQINKQSTTDSIKNKCCT